MFALILVGLVLLYFFLYGSSDTEKFEQYENHDIEIVNYHTTWCGYSKMFLPIWKDFEFQCKSKYPRIRVRDVICENGNGECKTKEIRGFPSVILFKDGKKIEYNGKRTVDSLLKFVESFSQ